MISETERLILYGIKHIIERDNWCENMKEGMDKDICDKIVEFVAPLKNQEPCCDMPEIDAKFNNSKDALEYMKENKNKTILIDEREFVKESQRESPHDLCSNCNHSRFDHTEKGEPIHCSYGGKGCGCDNFVKGLDGGGK